MPENGGTAVRLKVPKVRRDKKCYVCKGARKIPTDLQKGVPVEVYEQDPFCSALCARVYWGNPIKGAPTGS